MQVVQALSRAVQQQAERPGIIDGDRTLTWREIGRRVPRAASALRQLGIGEGDRVAVLSNNSASYLELFAVAPWAGGVIVPLNTRWSDAELAHAVDDCGLGLLLVGSGFEETGERLARKTGVTVVDLGAEYEDLIAAHGPVEPSGRGGDDLFGLFYTGGTTGRPKGVMLSHDNLMAVSIFWIANIKFDSSTRYLHSAQLFHMAGAAPAVALTLAGGTHVVIPKFEAANVLASIERHRVTYGLFVPTMLDLLLAEPTFAGADLSSLRRIEYGAAPMPVALLERVLQELPQVQFIQGYGCTEATALLCSLSEEHHDLTAGASDKLTSCGRPVPGVDLRIVDPTGTEVRRGDVGEIVVRGPIVMRGYWNMPEATDQAFFGDWLRTGDGAYMDDDGYVFIVDRIKDMIISGGENIFSGEVEQAIYRLDGVAECAVIGVPDDRWGERVHAIVRPRPGTVLEPDAVIAHCRDRIAHYKCPTSVEIRNDPLPTSAAGKLQKGLLRDPYWAGRTRQVG